MVHLGYRVMDPVVQAEPIRAGHGKSASKIEDVVAVLGDGGDVAADADSQACAVARSGGSR